MPSYMPNSRLINSMLYHTAMIILHRPPRNLFKDPKIAKSEDVGLCYESLESIVKLLRIYSRNYHFNSLPFTFVHILASAASIILMKRYIENLPWDDQNISKSLGFIVEALESVSQTWPCAKQVLGVINGAMKHSPQDDTRNDSPDSFDLMTSLQDTSSYDSMNTNMGFDMVDAEIALYDDYLDVPFQWNDGSFP
jgi:hypothetical protein